jgi:hypothetical protein
MKIFEAEQHQRCVDTDNNGRNKSDKAYGEFGSVTAKGSTSPGTRSVALSCHARNSSICGDGDSDGYGDDGTAGIGDRDYNYGIGDYEGNGTLCYTLLQRS